MVHGSAAIWTVLVSLSWVYLSAVRYAGVGNLCTTIAIDSLDSFDSVAVVTVAVASTIGKAIATAAMR